MGAREIEDDYEDQDFEVFSPQSPLGAALIGATKGETVDFEAPNGKTQRIEIVDAVPVHRLIHGDPASPRPGTRAPRGCPVVVRRGGHSKMR